MAEYVLDLTHAVLPPWWPSKAPKKIPICDGKWFRQYDVIEERVPGLRGLMLLASKRNFPEAYARKTIGLPFGFDRYCLPAGAAVVTLGIEPN